MELCVTNPSPVKTDLFRHGRQAKTDPPSKNRVWDFESTLPLCAGHLPSQPLGTVSETSATITATVSGLPLWPSRDPIGERGGLNVYGFVRNAPTLSYDRLGLECEMIVLIGHGTSHDIEENWLLQQARMIVPLLDNCDGYSLYGCNVAQVIELMQGDDVPLDEHFTRDFIRGEGLVWRREVGPNRGDVDPLAAWNSMVNGMQDRVEAICDQDDGCCADVWLTFECQEGDPAIDSNVRGILDLGHAVTRFIEDLQPGETFCGRTWRWNCDAEYWVLDDGEWAGR